MKKISSYVAILGISFACSTAFAISQTVTIDLAKYTPGETLKQAFPQPFPAGPIQCSSNANLGQNEIQIDITDQKGHKLVTLSNSSPSSFTLSNRYPNLSKIGEIIAKICGGPAGPYCEKIKDKYCATHQTSRPKPACNITITCKNI